MNKVILIIFLFFLTGLASAVQVAADGAVHSPDLAIGLIKNPEVNNASAGFGCGPEKGGLYIADFQTGFVWVNVCGEDLKAELVEMIGKDSGKVGAKYRAHYRAQGYDLNINYTRFKVVASEHDDGVSAVIKVTKSGRTNTKKVSCFTWC